MPARLASTGPSHSPPLGANSARPTRQMKLDDPLAGESDRAVALIVAAWVDDALGDLLRAYLVQDAKVIEEMFKPMAPLSTFSAKIKAAHLVGLIDKRQFENLDTI